MDNPENGDNVIAKFIYRDVRRDDADTSIGSKLWPARPNSRVISQPIEKCVKFVRITLRNWNSRFGSQVRNDRGDVSIGRRREANCRHQLRSAVNRAAIRALCSA